MASTLALACSLVFNLNLGQPGYEVLMQSDGTAAGTQILRDLDGPDENGFRAAFLQRVGNHAVFHSGRFDRGWEPYRTDGTSKGTRMIGDFARRENSSLPYHPKSGRIETIGNRAYFDQVEGKAPSIIVYDADTGTASVVPGEKISDRMEQSPGIIGVVGSSLILSYVDHNDDILAEWNTVSGQTTVKEDISGIFTYVAHALNDTRYLFAWEHYFFQDGELLATDAGSGAVTKLADVRSVSNFHAVPGGALFTAWSEVYGTELWFTDGTRGGTRVINLSFGGGSSDPADLTTVGEYTYFTAEAVEGQRQIWRTDGTSNGTLPVAGTMETYFGPPTDLANFAGRLLYTIGDSRLKVMEVPNGKPKQVYFRGRWLGAYSFRVLNDRVIIYGSASKTKRSSAFFAINEKNMTKAIRLTSNNFLENSYDTDIMKYAAKVGNCY